MYISFMEYLKQLSSSPALSPKKSIILANVDWKVVKEMILVWMSY